MNKAEPCTIIRDNYKGKHSGGRYIAFNRREKYVDPNVSNSKATWDEFIATREIYGVGDTPAEAEADLCSKVVIF